MEFLLVMGSFIVVTFTNSSEKRKIAMRTHDIRIKNSMRATDVIVRKSGANYGSASASGSSWTGSSSSSGISSKSVSLASSAYTNRISNMSTVSGYSTASGESCLFCCHSILFINQVYHCRRFRYSQNHLVYEHGVKSHFFLNYLFVVIVVYSTPLIKYKLKLRIVNFVARTLI